MMKKEILALSSLPGLSGREDAVREAIMARLQGNVESMRVDALGNVLVHKRGKQRAKHRILLDAHLDEVGFMVTDITDEGYLHIAAVGGVAASVCAGRRLTIQGRQGDVTGVSIINPVHLTDAKDKLSVPAVGELAVDIGARSRDEASAWVDLGAAVLFYSDKSNSFTEKNAKNKQILSNDKETILTGKALDNRVGCAVLCDILCGEVPYDIDAAFTVQEELGLRGAKMAAYAMQPEIAIILETTTAADVPGIAPAKQVCVLGDGVAVSFLDNANLYDRDLYQLTLKTAEEQGIKAQPKRAGSGGNNAGAYAQSAGGARTLAISVPCRNLHSPACVCDFADVEEMKKLALAMIERLNANAE